MQSDSIRFIVTTRDLPNLEGRRVDGRKGMLLIVDTYSRCFCLQYTPTSRATRHHMLDKE